MSGIEIAAAVSAASVLLAVALGAGAFLWVPVMAGLGWAATNGR